jgi:hypothetical protein
MPRIGPLRELPLDQFLPQNPNLRPNKRPLSPILYSPAKRRILNEEGIFSPEKTRKSPISVRGTPSRFTGTLSGPSSPARKLDFGTPKHPVKDSGAPNMSTPARPASSSNRLAPSPELKSNSQSSRSADETDGDPSMHNRSHSSAAPTSVPRRIPPPPDPQSIHYPGFRVHFDKQIFITSVDNGLESLSLVDNDKDGQKENTAPRRKPRKVATASNADLKSQLFSPDTRKRVMEKLNKTKSTPVTPKRLHGLNRQESGDSPTPRRGLAQAVTSSTPRAMEGERKLMRRALQDEVDDASEVEDDEA